MTETNLQKLALEIIADSKTEEEKIEKLYHYVKEKVKYKLTIIGDPEEILKLSYGSCIDNSLLFAELLKSIKIKSRYRVILVDFNLVSRIIFLAKVIPPFLRIPFYFHIFNEVYSQGEWKKFDTSFDSEIEKYFLGKKFASGETECCVPKKYISKDLGSFNNLSDVFAEPFFSQLVNQLLSFKEIAQFGINLFNWFLYIKRKNKTKGLKVKETIENILRNIEKLKKY